MINSSDRMQYINMDDRYRPEVVYFEGLNGLGQVSWWNRLFGKPQAWYDRLNEIQNTLTVLTAEVSEFGKSVWDAVRKTATASIGAPPLFPTYDSQINSLMSAAASIIVSKTRVPSDAAVDAADVVARTTRGRVAYAMKIAPELAADVARAAANMTAIVSETSLKSPADVGKKVFLEDLEKRAKGLGFGLGIGTLVIGGVALLALMASKQFRPNPRRRGRRRSGGPDLKKIALYGGLGYLAYTQFLAPKSA